MDVIKSYEVTFMGEGKVPLIRCLKKEDKHKDKCWSSNLSDCFKS